MITTTYESKYLLINFITEYKILIYSLNESLDTLNQITLTRRPISSTYFIKLLKEVYNVDSNTIIGISGNINEKGRYYSLLLGYCSCLNIRIRKLDFYQACERVNCRYKIVDSKNKLINWYRKYHLLYSSIITKKSIKFINEEFISIINNRSINECKTFKKCLLLLLYINIRESYYRNTKKSLCNKRGYDYKENDINISENKICIIE